MCLFITQKGFDCCSLRIPVINIQKKVCEFEVVMVLPSLCSSVIKRKKQDKEFWPTVKAYWEFKSNKEVSPRGQGRLLGSSHSSSPFDSKFLFIHQNIPVCSFQCIYFECCGTFHLWDWVSLMGLLGMLLNFFQKAESNVGVWGLIWCTCVAFWPSKERVKGEFDWYLFECLECLFGIAFNCCSLWVP